MKKVNVDELKSKSFLFGFGNIPALISNGEKAEKFFVGANGSYILETVGEALSSHTPGKKKKEPDEWRLATAVIINGVGTDVLKDYLKTHDVEPEEPERYEKEIEALIYNAVNDRDELKKMGVRVNKLSVESLIFRGEEAPMPVLEPSEENKAGSFPMFITGIAAIILAAGVSALSAYLVMNKKIENQGENSSSSQSISTTVATVGTTPSETTPSETSASTVEDVQVFDGELEMYLYGYDPVPKGWGFGSPGIFGAVLKYGGKPISDMENVKIFVSDESVGTATAGEDGWIYFRQFKEDSIFVTFSYRDKSITHVWICHEDPHVENSERLKLYINGEKLIIFGFGADEKFFCVLKYDDVPVLDMENVKIEIEDESLATFTLDKNGVIYFSPKKFGKSNVTFFYKGEKIVHRLVFGE